MKDVYSLDYLDKKIIKSNIMCYYGSVIKDSDNCLLGVIFGYGLHDSLNINTGNEYVKTFKVLKKDVYAKKKNAEKALKSAEEDEHQEIIKEDAFTLRNSDKINVKLIKPEFEIGQEVYVAQKEGTVRTNVYSFDVRIIENEKSLLGIIIGYKIDNEVLFLNDYYTLEKSSTVCSKNLFSDEKTAREASRFLEVKLDENPLLAEEKWKTAIGDKNVSYNSPYYFLNSNLFVSWNTDKALKAKKILNFCKREGGLIVKHRDELAGILGSCGIKYDKKSPLAEIFEQLGINEEFLEQDSI